MLCLLPIVSKRFGSVLPCYSAPSTPVVAAGAFRRAFDWALASGVDSIDGRADKSRSSWLESRRWIIDSFELPDPPRASFFFFFRA
jgi:hypothetical protein